MQRRAMAATRNAMSMTSFIGERRKAGRRGRVGGREAKGKGVGHKEKGIDMSPQLN
jgi:hypothetical protein